MKNYDEMYQSVLSKYDEYLEQKRKRKLKVMRTVPALACFCFCAVLGFGYWNHFQKMPNIPVQSSVIEETTIEIPDTTTAITNDTATQTENKTETASTSVRTSATVTERTTATGRRTVTTVVSSSSEALTTEQATEMHTEPQAPAMTEPATNTQSSAETSVVTTETIQTTTAPLDVRELKFGYPEEGKDGHYAPSSSNKIVMKCNSFCRSGEKLIVDAAMADVSLRPDKYDRSVVYQYEVFVCNTINYQNAEDERFIANGERKGYKKEYTQEEKALLDINGEADNFDLYHHEITELDFSDFTEGDLGCIAFSFKAVYNADSLHPSYMGSNQFMYFYAGEMGTAISNVSVEDAMKEYERVSLLL